MSIFTGSGVAIITPFKENGSIDFEAFKTLIDFQLENQTDALIICGTTGEASTLTDDEQIECIRFAADVSGKKVPIVAGAGSNDTDHGIRLCKRAKEVGADACLLVTPYYNKTSQKGLFEHYEAHAKAVDIPLILYNVPSRTGLNITPATAEALSKIDTIVAIKEASGDIGQVAETAHRVAGRMDIYSGNDNEILPVLSLGGIGVISVLANVAPKLTHDMVMKYLEGSPKEALELQLKSLPLINALFCEVNPIPVKTAIKHMGIIKDGWHFRRPLTTMVAENEERLVEILRDSGL